MHQLWAYSLFRKESKLNLNAENAKKKKKKKKLRKQFSFLPYRLSKRPLKRDFLDIYLTTCFWVPKFNNTSVMTVIFFEKILKIESKFRKCQKNWENIFRFWENCSWKCGYKLSLLRREYFSLADNGLTNTRKVLHITKRELFELNCVHMDQ